MATKIPILTIPNFYNPNFIEKWKFKKVIDKNYEQYFPWQGMSVNMNVPVLSEYKVFSKLYDRFLTTSREMFGEFKLSKSNLKTCWAYRGNNIDRGNRTDLWWHNHAHSSTINAVYYLQVFNDGVSFIGLDGEVFDYVPKNNELIIFPADLVHSPQPCTLQKYRYSVNMEILTEETVSDLFSRVFKYGFS
tara:strand:- start:155 stop:724 length:570 start_codon:yes stop_codon:yes gene_type:complete